MPIALTKDKAMLPESVKPGISLLENDNHGLNLVRWMHQCELMKHYYQADKVFVLQKIDAGYEVIVSAADNSMQLAPGKIFDADTSLLQRMAYSSPDGLNLDLTQGTADEYPDEFRSILCILSRPVHWPDGSVFGCYCSRIWRYSVKITALKRCRCEMPIPACSIITVLL
jgi:hypothetical protein